jgi:hypothetical protein
LNRPVLNKLKTRNQVGHKLIWTLFIPGKPELTFSNSLPALPIPLQKKFPRPITGDGADAKRSWKNPNHRCQPASGANS